MATAPSATAAHRAVIRRLTPESFNEGSPCTRRRKSLCGWRQIDDLFILQPGHQAGDFLSRHRLVAELQAEHAARGAVDDDSLIGVEKRRDIRHACIRREPDKGARRRFLSKRTYDGLFRP